MSKSSRHTGDGVRRAAAIGMLLTIVVGMPALLILTVGWPLPTSLPGWQGLQDAATNPLSPSAIINVLACGAWLAWAHFTACALAELRGELTGRTLHIPLGGPNQQLARRLMAAALLTSAVLTGTGGLTAAHATVVPATSTPSSTLPAAAAPPTVSTRLTELSDHAGAATSTSVRVDAAAPPAAAAAGGPIYLVQTPQGGRADNLWDLAEQYLGDGARWREIYQLNAGQPQTGGDALSNPDVIRAGWQLQMPADAYGLPSAAAVAAPIVAAEAEPPAAATPAAYTVQPGDTLRSIAQDRLGDETRAMELYGANRTRTQPDGERLVDADLIRPGWILQLPATTGPATTTIAPAPAPKVAAPPAPAAAPAAPAPAAEPVVPPPVADAPADGDARRDGGTLEQRAEQAAPDAASNPAAQGEVDTEAETVWVRTAGGIGALLAAFVLTLLVRRRRLQQARRKPGQRITMPTGSAETTEQELRTVQDPIGTVELDLALRQLAAAMHTAGHQLPQVRAARLTADAVELYLVEPAEAPAPWHAGLGGMWTLQREQLRDGLVGLDADALPAPYPALVTVGQDEEAGHVLVDLEQISSLGVTGSTRTGRAVLTALALELSSSTWASVVDVTLVGLCPELPAALPERPGRLRHTDDLTGLLGELERHADDIGAGLTGAGLDSARAARGSGTAPDGWTPHVLLLAEPVPEELRGRLADVLARLPQVGIAAVTGAGQPLGEWALQVDPDGRGLLQPAGLAIDVQQIPADRYADVLEQLAVSVQPAAAGPGWTANLTDEPVQLADLPQQLLDDEPDGHRAQQPTQRPAADEPQPPGELASSVRVDLTGTVPRRADALLLGGPGDLTGAEAAAESADGGAGDTPAVAPGGMLAAASCDDPVGGGPHAATPTTSQVDRAESGAAAAGVLPVVVDLTEPAPSAAQAAAVGLHVIAEPDPPPAVPRVRVLGNLAVLGARNPPPVAKNAAGVTVANTTVRCTALITYLALNPGAVSGSVLAEQLSPARTWKTATTNNVLTKARTWLGSDEHGLFLPKFAESNSYRLRSDVRTDWHDWLDLIGTDVTATPTARLEQALALVRGAPFSNINAEPNYYAWAEPIRMEIVDSIVDVAHEVAGRVLRSRDRAEGHDLPASSRGRAALARRAVWVGRLVDPGSELIWRDALMVAYRTGNTMAMRQLANDVVQQAEDLECSLEPETEQLLNDLQALAR